MKGLLMAKTATSSLRPQEREGILRKRKVRIIKYDVVGVTPVTSLCMCMPYGLLWPLSRKKY